MQKLTFQLTTSRRGRLCNTVISHLVRSFNSRPHAEVDCCCDNRAGQADILSTHDLTQRSTMCHHFPAPPMIFQLTTSRRGRRCAPVPGKNSCDLSTHDLTQRSTIIELSTFILQRLSTHDLTQRSTHPLDITSRECNLSTHDLTQRSTTYIL